LQALSLARFFCAGLYQRQLLGRISTFMRGMLVTDPVARWAPRRSVCGLPIG